MRATLKPRSTKTARPAAVQTPAPPVHSEVVTSVKTDPGDVLKQVVGDMFEIGSSLFGPAKLHSRAAPNLTQASFEARTDLFMR